MIGKIVLVLVALYGVAMAYLYFTQEKQIFNASAIEIQAPISGANRQNITFTVEENVVLEGIYQKSTQENAPLVIYFGGNADDATRLVLHVNHLVEYDILAFNYRGYVKSSGKPSEKALFEDALRIYDAYAKDRKVIVVGRSLGTGVATFLASQREVAGLVLITPYDSIVSLAEQKYPIFPIDTLLRHKFETIRYIPKVNAKIAIIEVDKDHVTPRYHLEKLLAVILQKPYHVTLFDTTHGKVLEHTDFEKEFKKILQLMSE